MKHPTKKEEKRLMDFTTQMEFLFAVNNFDRSFTYKKVESENDGSSLDVSVDIPYQRIHINVYPCFWNESLKEQRKQLLHEFCHTVIYPVQSVANDLFGGKFRTEKEIKDAVEQSTSRITELLHAQLIDRNKYAKVAYKKYLK